MTLPETDLQNNFKSSRSLNYEGRWRILDKNANKPTKNKLFTLIG